MTPSWEISLSVAYGKDPLIYKIVQSFILVSYCKKHLPNDLGDKPGVESPDQEHLSDFIRLFHKDTARNDCSSMFGDDTVLPEISLK